MVGVLDFFFVTVFLVTGVVSGWGYSAYVFSLLLYLKELVSMKSMSSAGACWSYLSSSRASWKASSWWAFLRSFGNNRSISRASGSDLLEICSADLDLLERFEDSLFPNVMILVSDEELPLFFSFFGLALEEKFYTGTLSSSSPFPEKVAELFWLTESDES